MEIPINEKLEVLQLDRGTIITIQKYIFNIQNRIEKLINEKSNESNCFQQWLIDLNNSVTKKVVIEDNLQVSRFFVVKDISNLDLEDCKLNQVMESELKLYNDEKVICEFDDSVWYPKVVENINPRYLLTDKRVYIIERVLKKNFWGTVKGLDIIEKGSFDINDIDLEDKAHQELFFHFLKIYSNVENEMFISEFECNHPFLLNKMDDLLKILPKDELKLTLKINFEIENMISSFNNDVKNIKNFNLPDVSFKIPLKLYAFQPGNGWGLNAPMLALLQDLRIKSLVISYCLIVRNLYLYSILNNDEVSKNKYLMLLEQHGLLESYFEKMTRSSMLKSSNKIINELKNINHIMDEINSQMSVTNEFKAKLNSIDNTLQFNSLISAYTAYKLS